MDNKTLAIVRFQVEGFHRWPAATSKHDYLGTRHRHMFHVEARLQVLHLDREVEYHDLLTICMTAFPGGEMGDMSCEQMAGVLRQRISASFPRRYVEVDVLEDGECGARVIFDPTL